MKMDLLGPEGIRQRMAEIRARMDALIGTRELGGQRFVVADKELTGKIGGFTPFNPTGKGIAWQPLTAPKELSSLIEQAAKDEGLDSALLDALVAAESAYDPNARSRAGALGLTQIMPDTAQALGIANPFDPLQNLKGGAKYLSQMISRYGGDLQLALAAYNAGPNAVDRFSGVPPYSETQTYVNRILELYRQRKGQ